MRALRTYVFPAMSFGERTSRLPFLHAAIVFLLAGLLAGRGSPGFGQTQAQPGLQESVERASPAAPERTISGSGFRLKAAGSAPSIRRKCTGSPGSCLDVLTYNVAMLASPPTKNISPNAKKRASEMVDRIARPDKHTGSGLSSLSGPVDVVVVNELVRNKPEDTLRNKLSKKYSYRMTDKNKPDDWNSPVWATEGGVEIYSRYKIKSKDYKRFSKKALKTRKNGNIDETVAHGVVHAEIEKKGKDYHIFATHFDTRAGPTDCSNQRKGWKNIQKRSIKEVNKFVQKKASIEPAIIAGDLNFGVGLQKCTKANRTAYGSALKRLGAVEPAHPKKTEAGKSQGRILDHIMIRNFPLSSQSFAERLKFQPSNPKIGMSGNNLSDHHPVYAFIQKGNKPTVLGTQTRVSKAKANPPNQQTGYPLTPTFVVNLKRSPSCNVPVEWEIARNSSFNTVTYKTTTRSKSLSLTVPPGKLDLNTTYYWRAHLKRGVCVHRQWPPRMTHSSDAPSTDVWAPSDKMVPEVLVQPTQFKTANPEVDRFDKRPAANRFDKRGDNDTKNSATVFAKSKWNHKGKHLICPNGGIVPTKNSGTCKNIFTTTKQPGSSAPLVAYEKWTMTVSNLTLDKKDRDYFKVKLPLIDLERNLKRNKRKKIKKADRRLENNPCATLTVSAKKRPENSIEARLYYERLSTEK